MTMWQLFEGLVVLAPIVVFALFLKWLLHKTFPKQPE